MATREGGGKSPHLSVLYQEIITAIKPVSGGRYVDATVGAGGHAWGILDASSPDGQLLGLDLDPEALTIASQRLESFQGRVHLVHSSYTSLSRELLTLNWDFVDGIVIDLGVSSMQIDMPHRGFSFLKEGPLDMRFDPSQSVSASEIVNTFPESEIADILYKYGEERRSRQIARAIVQARPLNTTLELAHVIQKVAGKNSGKIHPATRSFQALRIAVNHELQSLEDFLPQAIEVLKPGGRLAVISFHSLEDRIVKQTFRRESQNAPEQPDGTHGHLATIKEINRHPIRAGSEEILQNPRARSARLRIIEKLEKQPGIA